MNKDTMRAMASLAALVIVNVAAQLFGATVDTDTATAVCLAIITAAVTAWAAWKDHDITAFAQFVKEAGLAAAEEAAQCADIIDAHGENRDGED